MKFLKAAAAASIAGLMCIGMMIPAYAQTTDEQTDSTALIAADADASEDGGYLKYKNNMMRKMLLDKTPVGRMRNDLDMCKSEYGSYLTHDVRFNGMGRHYGIDISQWQTTDIDCVWATAATVRQVNSELTHVSMRTSPTPSPTDSKSAHISILRL